jgi:hypothetical protein
MDFFAEGRGCGAQTLKTAFFFCVLRLENADLDWAMEML